jgi:hypothetical protein
LHLALDLSNTTSKLAFATGVAHAPRLRSIPARDLAQLGREIAAAQARFGLPADAPVVSCYEAVPAVAAGPRRRSRPARTAQSEGAARREGCALHVYRLWCSAPARCRVADTDRSRSASRRAP